MVLRPNNKVCKLRSNFIRYIKTFNKVNWVWNQEKYILEMIEIIRSLRLRLKLKTKVYNICKKA